MAFLWLIHGGDPNHLLTRMILQVHPKTTEYRKLMVGSDDSFPFKNGTFSGEKLVNF